MLSLVIKVNGKICHFGMTSYLDISVVRKYVVYDFKCMCDILEISSSQILVKDMKIKSDNLIVKSIHTEGD